MSLNYDVIPEIVNTIRSIEDEYQHNQGLILTESDLGSLLYGRLRGIFLRRPPVNSSGLYWRMSTQDPHIFASPLHLEAPWYDNDGKLTIRPDITILEPDQLSILHRYGDGLKLPSKQFEFGGNAIVLELKFIRYKSGITPHVLEKIKEDFEKIEKLKRRLGNTNLLNSLYCFFVVFNKTDNRCPEFDEYLSRRAQGNWYKYIYGTGKVAFNKNATSSLG